MLIVLSAVQLKMTIDGSHFTDSLFLAVVRLTHWQSTYSIHVYTNRYLHLGNVEHLTRCKHVMAQNELHMKNVLNSSC